MSRTELYAIVQHSGYGYAGKPGFKQGLETRNVTRKKAAEVLRKGGVVFDGYVKAEEYAMAEMYSGAGGLYPTAPGRFHGMTIDGLHVYIPVTRPQQILHEAEAIN